MFTTLEEAFLANNFTKIGTDFPNDEGLQILMSRFNHSCAPNAMIPNLKGFDDMDPETTVMISTKRITAGTEITFSYNIVHYYLRRGERRLALSPTY
ncbi:SET domain-containing protein [Apiospora saccharicola]